MMQMLRRGEGELENVRRYGRSHTKTREERLNITPQSLIYPPLVHLDRQAGITRSNTRTAARANHQSRTLRDTGSRLMFVSDGTKTHPRRPDWRAPHLYTKQ